MSSVTPSALPVSTSTSTRYSLEVEYISDTSKKRSFSSRRSRLYAEVTLGDTTDRSCSIKEEASQPWKHIFTLLSSEQKSEITIGVFQLSAVQKRNTSVGSCNFKLDNLVEQCKNGNVELTLSSQLGLLRIRLVVINEISYNLITIRNVGTKIGRHKGGRLSRLMGLSGRSGGFVASQLDENDDLYKNIGDLLQKLDVFSQIAGDIASIEPHMKAAWAAISALYKGISNQIERDRRVVDLVRKLLEKFKFVDDNESLRNKTLFLKSAIESLLKITEECCTFIKKYFDRLFIRRMISLRDGQQIYHYERSIEELTKSFDDGTRRYDDAVKKQTDLRVHLRPTSNMEGFGRPRCLENTQLETRHQINEWIDSETEKRVFWLHGVAGSGKSTIATTIAEELRETRQLGAFLFFDRATSKPKDVIRTMAYKLAMSNPVIATHVSDDAFGDNTDYSSANTLLDKLILHPITASSSEVEKTVVIILDAMDECGDPLAREELLQSLETAFSRLPTNFRLLITSRPEPDLHDLLYTHPSVLPFKLDPEASKRDVLTYLSLTLANIFRRRGAQPVPEDWPWDENIKFLGEIACGLFIWASTSCKYVEQSGLKEFKALNKLINDIRAHGHAEFGIGELYSEVLKSVSIPWDDEEVRLRFSRILHLILEVDVALSADDIDIILGLSPQSSSRLIVSKLQSVLTYTPGSHLRVRPLHASFGDFLTSNGQSQSPWYTDITNNREYIDDQRRLVGEQCLSSFNTIDRMLHSNSNNIKTFFKQRDRIPNLQSRFAENLPADLRSACLSWLKLLRISPFSQELLNKLSHFLQTHLRVWIEVMFGMGKLDLADSMLEDCIAWVEGHNTSLEQLIESARKHIADTKRCVDSFALMGGMLRFNICDIETSFKLNRDIPNLQGRISKKIPTALKEACLSWAEQLCNIRFSPVLGNILSEFLHNHLLSWLEVLSLIENVYLARLSCWKTIEWVAGKNDSLEALLRDIYKIISTFQTPISESLPHIYVSMLPLACHGSNMAAHYARSISPATKVEIVKGGLSNKFDGHADAIRSIACSPDGKYITSGSVDGTVIVWNVESGEPITGPFKGHSGPVLSVAYAPDGKHIVSGSRDGTVIVWNAEGGELVAGPFKGHSGYVYSVAYSPDGKRIVSCSDDNTVKVWGAEGGELARPLEGHSGYVFSIAYSPDGKHIVSGSDDRTVIVWDVDSGKLVAGPFEGHSGVVYSVRYSPDGKHIVSGSADRTVIVWNAESGKLVAGPFKGHSGTVWSVAYSPDGKYIVLGSGDGTVRVWSVESGKLVAGPFKGHTDRVSSVAYSPNGKHVISGSDDRTIRVWNAPSGIAPFASNISTKWDLSKDGWIRGRKGELLLWIPLDTRRGIYYPHSVAILNRLYTIKLHFMKDRVGENWMRCIESEE